MKTSHRIILSPVLSFPSQGERLRPNKGAQTRIWLRLLDLNSPNLTGTLPSCWFVNFCFLSSRNHDSSNMSSGSLALTHITQNFRHCPSRTSPKFDDSPAATRGHCSQAFSTPHLCGIPYCELIKTRQTIVAADKGERERTPRGSAILKHQLSV